MLARRAALVAAQRASPSIKVLGTQSYRVARMFSTAPQSSYAVEAPDGTPDDLIQEEMHEVEELIDFEAAHPEFRDAIIKQHEMDEKMDAEARKIFAIEAPDGTSDDLLNEEIHEAEELLEINSLTEDAEKIDMRHQVETEVRKEQARDPEHDW